jgi:hypothetical protein
MERYGDTNSQNARKTSCPSETLTITNVTQTGLGWNQGFRDEEPAINCVSHGMASKNSTFPVEYKTIHGLIRRKVQTALC